MSRRSHVLVGLAGLSIAMLGRGAAIASPVDGGPGGQEMISLGLRGVYFVPNQGQWSDEEVHFGLKTRGLDVAFRESALTMHLARQAGEPSPDREGVVWGAESPEALLHGAAPEIRGDDDSAPAWEQLTLSVTFPGSNEVLPVGAQPQEAKFNYFVGGEGRSVASDVPSFGAVIYENLYDGVDLHVMGSDDGVLKYEFHVEPGADYSQIAIAYDGIESLCANDDGDLEIATSFGTLSDGAPLVWQEDADGASRTDIAARFELIEAHTYRIALDGAVDPTRALIIDPDVEWMLYLGGTAYDHAYGTALDSSGNIFVTGATLSPDFVGRTNDPNDGREAYLLKISAQGKLLWMTYIGGSADDIGNDIAIDPSSDIIMAGTTSSEDFPGRLNSHQVTEDAFVLKTTPSGAIVWMLYLGGEWRDQGNGVTVDPFGEILVTGQTGSTGFQGRLNSYNGGEWDAYAARISPAGELQWALYLGGSLDDIGQAVTVNDALDVFVVGTTRSTNFAGRTNSSLGARDTFVLNVSPAGALNWMTYFGGSHEDYGYSIGATHTGDVVFTGITYSLDFVGRTNLHNGGIRDAYVARAAASGAILWMKYFGGSHWDHGYTLALDDADYIYVGGETVSTDFAGRDNEYRGGSFDAFVLRTTPAGTMEWMRYLGGIDEDRAWSIAVRDGSRIAVAGWTASPDFEGRTNYLSRNGDAFAVGFRQDARPQLEVDGSCPQGGPIRIAWYNATPRGRVGLLFCRREGNTSVPPGHACAGTVLGLGVGVKQVFTGLTGSSGSATLFGETRPETCGGFLQLLDVATCATSNVVRIE